MPIQIGRKCFEEGALENTPTHRPNWSRRRFLQFSGAGLLAPCLPGCGSDSGESRQFTETIAWGRQAILERMDRNPDVASVSIALLYKDDLVWQEAFGLASVDEQRPATVDTRFNVGSVSKVLAGLAGAILQDEGLLDLNSPVFEYLPGFAMLSPQYRQITVRQLLSHASGLPGTSSRGIFTFAPMLDYAQDTEAGLAHFHLKHTPGQLAVYCNDGFTLFERVVAAVSGLSYPEFVRQRVFEPLDMKLSGYLLQPSAPDTVALPYLEGRQYEQEFCNGYATGGLCSTPGDMMKLARMFIGNGVYRSRRIVSAAGIADMGTEQNSAAAINPSPEWRWGLGWDSVRQSCMDAAGQLAWQKNGGTAFFQSEFFVLPEAGMALLVTGNAGYGPLDVAEGVLLRALVEARAASSMPPAIVASMPGPAAPPSDLADVAGVYGNYEAPFKVETAADGALYLRRWKNGGWEALTGGALRFTLRSDGWWWSDDGRLPSYRFEVVEVDEEGQRVHYRYLMMRLLIGTGCTYTTMPVGQQLSAREPLPAAWRTRLGTQWRFVNDVPGSIAQALDNEPVALESLPELPGYVFFGGTQLLIPLGDDRAGMAVKVPVNDGRDLNEIEFPPDGNGASFRIGSAIYQRVEA